MLLQEWKRIKMTWLIIKCFAIAYCFLKFLYLVWTKLISTKRRNTRLDSSCSQCNQKQTYHWSSPAERTSKKNIYIYVIADKFLATQPWGLFTEYSQLNRVQYRWNSSDSYDYIPYSINNWYIQYRSKIQKNKMNHVPQPRFSTTLLNHASQPCFSTMP